MSVIKRRTLLIAGSCFLLSGFALANNTHTIKQRIEPVGKLRLDNARAQIIKTQTPAAVKPIKMKNAAIITQTPAETTQPVIRVSNGQKVYQQFCMACHAQGAAGAPKLNDPAQWQARIKQGRDVLIEHVIKGYKFMPPMGTCMSCTKNDIEAAVDYMLNAVKQAEKS